MNPDDENLAVPRRPVGDHAYIPPPSNLPAFLDVYRVRPKGGRIRWSDSRGFVYEWDRRHGALEIYDARGRHLGEYDHVTGAQLKWADPRRRIDP